MVTLEIAGQTLWLLPERAVFLPESDTLVVADADLGEAPGAQAPGVVPPGGVPDDALTVLSRLVRRLEVQRIIFLGDVLHSMRALAPETRAAVTRWRERHSALELTLVRGQQAGRAADPLVTLDIQPFDAPLMHRGLALCHEPRPVDGAFALAGHVHPCVSVGGRAHDWHRLPCFWFSPRVGVLPAFGSFTGMQTIRVAAGERVFAATAERVIELQPRPKRR